MAHVHDISEGGLSVRDYNGPALQPGASVEIHVDGILSDDLNARSSRVALYQMEVVHNNGQLLGLKF
jgi:hypothetical protein